MNRPPWACRPPHPENRRYRNRHHGTVYSNPELWNELRKEHEAIKAIEDKVCRFSVDFNEDALAEVPLLRAQGQSLTRKFEIKVAEHTQADCLSLAALIAERCSAEIREIVYSYLCIFEETVMIPDRQHYVLSMRTIEEITEPDWDAEKEIADYEVHKLRQRAIFRPEWVGRQVAEEVTRKFLEENLFHFRDTRWCMESFLMTPFPYGSRPIDLIRDLRIYVRCEDFVYWAGITVPRMMEEMELEEPDYGDEVGTYDIIHGNVQCLLRIPFNKNQKIRLVIVELFGRYGLDTMDLDLVRIGMNFEEAILEAYVKLKSEAADVQVASIVDDEFDVLSGAMELSRSWLDILHTWEIELAAQHFHTRKSAGQYPQYAYPDRPPPRHFSRWRKQIDELEPQKAQERKEQALQIQRENEAWNTTHPPWNHRPLPYGE